MLSLAVEVIAMSFFGCLLLVSLVCVSVKLLSMLILAGLFGLSGLPRVKIYYSARIAMANNHRFTCKKAEVFHT